MSGMSCCEDGGALQSYMRVALWITVARRQLTKSETTPRAARTLDLGRPDEVMFTGDMSLGGLNKAVDWGKTRSEAVAGHDATGRHTRGRSVER